MSSTQNSSSNVSYYPESLIQVDKMNKVENEGKYKRRGIDDKNAILVTLFSTSSKIKHSFNFL